MAYLLMIVEERGQRARHDHATAHRLYDEMMAYTASLAAEGVLIHAESLAVDAEGVRFRSEAGKPRRIDGPFTEAKEMVGGFFLVNVASRAAAEALAARCPAIHWAQVEVRACASCLDSVAEETGGESRRQAG